jgi:hypothetical protein
MSDDLVKRPDDEQDDLTLVYMWAYKMAEKKYKSRIEQLEADIGALKAAFRVNMLRANASHEEIDTVIRAALGEKKDGTAQ